MENNHSPPDKTTTQKKRAALIARSLGYPGWHLNERQICDLELLANGAFAPLQGFMNRRDYQRVLDDMRLAGGDLWPIPVMLDIDPALAETLSPGDCLTLKDDQATPVAIMRIEDLWAPDLAAEAEAVYGTRDLAHPGVARLLRETRGAYVGGHIEHITPVEHSDYADCRHTPAELKAEFRARGWERVVAFQTRNPMHRAHIEMTKRAVADRDAGLLIHPAVGMTKPGDIDYHTRVRCYKQALPRYPKGGALLSLLPLAMRMAGPREAVWHGLIRKNCGCTHMIVGRDHAGPGKDDRGRPYYDPYGAQRLFEQHQEEIGIEPVVFKALVYAPARKHYVAEDEIAAGEETLTISGTELRDRLARGAEIPSWFTYPEIENELRRAYPPTSERGMTIFFTGLPCSGKSTLAAHLMARLMEGGETRKVSLLDGDVVRSHLSSGLNFSREHRSLNVRRIGFVASLITKSGGIAICAPIAPYAADRDFNRALISQTGGYIEVYVSTPLAVCEARDIKGLYRGGRAKQFERVTGIDDPYEPPANPEITVDTSQGEVDKLLDDIVDRIKALGYL